MGSIVADSFVSLTPLTHETVIFGRNSYRPEGEATEVQYFAASTEAQSTQKCDNVEVSGAPSVAIILNKTPSTWGGESGANIKGVAVGISWDEKTSTDGLTATDIVRLALERSSSASEVVTVIGELADEHGPDGVEGVGKQCFIVADAKEVWIVNVVGKLWAAESIDTGCRRIPAALTVTTKIDKSSENLPTKAQDLNIWNGEGDFNFSEVFGSPATLVAWPNTEANDGSFTVTDMFRTLRETSAVKLAHSSHVSTLTSISVPCHWFTATPNPEESVFKPFVFTENSRISPLTKLAADAASDDVTLLQRLHTQRNWPLVGDLLQSLESSCVTELNGFLAEVKQLPPQEFDELLKDCVEAEVKFYR